MSQERNMIITDLAIYNLKKKELKRRIEISTLKGISASSITEEFVLHGIDIEYDYDFVSSKRMTILKIVNEAYKAMKGADISFCKLEEKSLKKIVTLKDEKKKDLNFSRMPSTPSSISEFYQPQNNFDINRSGTIFSRKKDYQIVKLSDFRPIKVLGRGSFGKVTMVEFVKTKELFAMKSLKKDVILDQDQVENTLLEKKILQELEHPFLVGLVFCFQTDERIYFILPFIHGGELFQHLRKFRVFDQEK